VTTEESRDSVMNQAAQFGMDFRRAVSEGRMIIIDALLGRDEWSLRSLGPEEMVNKVIEAKKRLGYGPARLVIDSMSAFWLDKLADGIIRFRRSVRGGVLRRFLIVEKMRQTPHDLRAYEVEIVDGVGMKLKRPTKLRAEDFALPWEVQRRIVEAREREEGAVPDQ